jgi:hypothetical protein
MKVQFVDHTYNDNGLYYHGTSLENLDKILIQKRLYVEYGNGENGVYITDSYLNASNHGEVIFGIDKQFIDNSRFHTDDVNDGILYLGGIEIDDNINLFLCYNDSRLLRSLSLNLLNRIKDGES